MAESASFVLRIGPLAFFSSATDADHVTQYDKSYKGVVKHVPDLLETRSRPYHCVSRWKGSVIATVSKPSKETRPVRLTRREREVLGLIAQGYRSREVAEMLVVSKRTVDFHLANIYHKLQVTNRLQAFRKASELGLIPFHGVGRPKK
jgi:DNA-binding NarL/FixJ family response regulator